MSTNFYLFEHTGNRLHIGKSSAGWQFLFNVGNPDSNDPLDTFDGWKHYITIAIMRGGWIEDEYGREIEPLKLQELILEKQLTGKNGWSAPDEVVGPWAAKRRKDYQDVMETYDRKGFRFSTARDFS